MKTTLLGAMLFAGLAGSANAVNVARGADVATLGDGFGQFYGCCNWFAPPSTVVDGLFHVDGDSSSSNSVFWTGMPNSIVVTLSAPAWVEQVTLQADSNDYYGIYYRVGNEAWKQLAFFSPVAGTGLSTRTAVFAPVAATAFSISGQVGDGFYAVTEFQAMGTALAVPEPASGLLLTLGVAWLFAIRASARH